jgi:hypothetical protein
VGAGRRSFSTDVFFLYITGRCGGAMPVIRIREANDNTELMGNTYGDDSQAEDTQFDSLLPTPHPERDARTAKPQGEYYVNLTSAIFSLASLLVLFAQTQALQFNFQTWVSFIPSVRNPYSVGLVQNFTTQFRNSCDIPDLKIATYTIETLDTTLDSSFVVMPMAFKSELVPASLMLIWVLAVSAAFQTYRARHMNYIWSQQAKDRFRYQIKLFIPHAVVHVMFWFRIFFLEIDGLSKWGKAAFLIPLTLTCTVIIFNKIEYVNDTQDFSRWLEYMLTAPVQIAIIAMSVWLRDRSTLLALGGAQACMLLCGVVIEACIADMYQTNRDGAAYVTVKDVAELSNGQPAADKIAKRNDSMKLHAQHVASATLVVAWVTFFLIWFVIVTQFQRQYATAGKCDNCASYDPFCAPIASVTQTINGTTFTMEPKAQKPCKACPIKGHDDFCKISDDGMCTGRNQIPSAVGFIVASQGLAFAMFGVVLTIQFIFAPGQHGEAKCQSAWYTVSIMYAVLSVTAKTSLEVGFIVMLTQMPESTLRA